jgi:hypothetical protein
VFHHYDCLCFFGSQFKSKNERLLQVVLFIYEKIGGIKVHECFCVFFFFGIKKKWREKKHPFTLKIDL